MYEGDYGKGEPPGQPSDHSVFGDEGCGSRTHLTAAGGRRSAHVGKLTHSTGSKSRLPQWAWKQNSAPSMGTIYCIQQGILKHGSLTQGHRDRRENDAVMLESSRDFSGLSQRQVMGWSDAGGLLRVITDFMIGVNPTLRAKNQAKLNTNTASWAFSRPTDTPCEGRRSTQKNPTERKKKAVPFCSSSSLLFYLLQRSLPVSITPSFCSPPSAGCGSLLSVSPPRRGSQSFKGWSILAPIQISVPSSTAQPGLSAGLCLHGALHRTGLSMLTLT